ncbi:MAG: hypothetical protein V4541_11355 [Bacteroidota bacterium]
MKLSLFYFAFLVGFFTCTLKAKSQVNPSIEIKARSYGDRIVLRYLPSSSIFFSQGNKVGYRVERAAYINGVPNEKLIFKPIKGSPFKRFTDEQWLAALNEEKNRDTSAAKLIGLAMIYSDPNGITNSGNDLLKEGLKSLKEQKDNADIKYGYALIAANRNKIAAEGLALRISDTDVELGKTYVYRVQINLPLTKPSSAGIAYIKVSCTNFNDQYIRNDKLVKIKELDQSVTFSFPEGDAYYAFNIERSDDEGKTYQRISKSPVLNVRPIGFTGPLDFAYGDTSLINYKKYHYSVWVSTCYADELLLAQFVAMPRDKTPPSQPSLKTATHIKPNQVELKWEIKQKGSEDLKGFTIKRGNKENGEYNLISKTILSSTSTSYIDETFNHTGSNYYIVEAIDTAGNKSASFPAYVTLTDSIPPAMPVISSAKIDSLGKIMIKIKPATEKDFMGYQLQKANAKDHEFSVVVETFKDSLGATTFTLKDSTTLNTLTKNIYYKVIAFDTHFNQSTPSAVIELKKRDTIPPVSPLIKDFLINDTSIVIVFANSSSEDVVSNYILRRENGKAKFDTVFVNKDNLVTRFTDLKISGGKLYEYAMIAKDDGGLLSKISRSIQLKSLLNNKIPAPVLSGQYNEQTKKIGLSFTVNEKLYNRKLTIEIYRRTHLKSTWLAYKTIPIEKGTVFLDDPPKDEKEVWYVVKLVDSNKNSSNYSNELMLKF